MGVARDGIVLVYLDTELIQFTTEGIGEVICLILGHNDRADVESASAEGVDKAKDVEIIGDTEVAPLLILFDVIGVNDDDNLRLVLKLCKHSDFTVRLEARENTRSVEIIKELAAEFKIELTAEVGYSLFDFLGLQLKIHIVIKANGKHPRHLLKTQDTIILSQTKS